MAFANSAAPRPHPLIVSRSSIQAAWDQSIAWLLSHYLQIAIALAVGTALVAAMLAVRSLAFRFCQRHPSLTHWPQTIGRVITQTHLAFIVLLACKLVDGYADPPETMARTVDTLFTIVAAIQGAVWVREFVLSVIEHRAGDDGHGTLSSAIGIIRLLVTIVLFAIAAVLILDNLGVNVTGLIAGLGIGGIAIGLAAKGIFDDLFSALSIIFDKPFRRGDSIRWDKTSGTVEAIGLKTTRIRATTGEEVVISNTNLLNKELHNLARLARRRVEFTLRLIYQTPASELAKLPTIIGDVIEGVDKCSLVRCGIADFSAPSIDIKVEFDVHSHDWNEVFAARSQVAIAIRRALEAARIEFAGPDGKSISPPVVPPPPGSAGAPDPEPEARSPA